MQDATIKIREEWWPIEIRPDVDNGDSYGHCDSTQKRILIARYRRKDNDDVELTQRERVETLLHEIIHAEMPDLSEEAVTRIGESLTAGLFETRILEESQ